MSLTIAIIFGILTAAAVPTGILLLQPGPKKKKQLFLILLIIIVFLGAALIVLTIRQYVEGPLKIFLIMTGAAPAALLICVFLHNALCGLLTVVLRKKEVVEEPVFFLLAIFGCPLAFVAGVVGSIVTALL